MLALGVGMCVQVWIVVWCNSEVIPSYFPAPIFMLQGRRHRYYRMTDRLWLRVRGQLRISPDSLGIVAFFGTSVTFSCGGFYSLLLPLRYRALPRRGRVTSSSDTVSDGTPCLAWVMRNAEKKRKKILNEIEQSSRIRCSQPPRSASGRVP
jgi:hypothetical protein